MISFDTEKIIARIRKKHSPKVKKWCLLRFERDEKGKVTFDSDSSTLSPDAFLNLTEKIVFSGFENLGGHTDKGARKLVSVEKVKEWRNNVLPFTNLYKTFFFRSESPSGLLVMEPPGFIFIPGMMNPFEQMLVDFTDQPKERKDKLSTISKKYNLKWWGSVNCPVIFRYCDLTEDSFQDFVKDFTGFFEEVGFAEI